MVTLFIQNIFISIQKEDSKQSNNRKSNFKLEDQGEQKRVKCKLTNLHS